MLSGLVTDTLVNLMLGVTSFNVPVRVAGRVSLEMSLAYLVAAKAVRGVMMGDPVGEVTVQG